MHVNEGGRLHARAEGLHLVVELQGGLCQNQPRVKAGLPHAAETQRDLLHQVMQRVALDVHGQEGVEVDARLRDGQFAETRASESGDGHQVMGPYDVTCMERCSVTLKFIKLQCGSEN